MKILDAIKEFFIAYYDKLVLGVMLITLAVVAMVKAVDMRTTRDQISEINRKIQDFLPEGELKHETFEQLRIQIEFKDDRLWSTMYLPAAWGREKTSDIYSIRGTYLQEWLRQRAEGSLVDPMVYVYSVNYTPYLLHWDTTRHPWTGTPQPRWPPSGEPPPPPPPDDDDDDDNPPKPPPSTDNYSPPDPKHIYVYKSEYPSLPFMLKWVDVGDPDDMDTWKAQVNVQEGRAFRTYVLKQGEMIPGTRFKITSIKPNQSDAKRSYLLIVKVDEDGADAGDERQMKVDQAVRRDEPVFGFVYIGALKGASGGDGDTIGFIGTDKGRYMYRVVVRDKTAWLQPLDEAGKPRGDAYKVPALPPTRVDERKQEIREQRQRERETQRPDEGAMMPMDGIPEGVDPMMMPMPDGAPPPEPMPPRR